tara:strand:+ start:2182 stop:2490 length:309 start_codon:yes stop_codon:yes gene_type:complete
MESKAERIQKCIFNSIDEWNKKSKDEYRLNKSDSTVLMGENSKLDSLGIVNFIVSVEENIEDEFDQSILLADEKAMSSEESPFSNVKSLSKYIADLLENVSE